MVLMLLVKRLIGLAITAAIIGFGYHYLKSRNVPVPANPTSQIQNTTNLIQNTQNQLPTGY